MNVRAAIAAIVAAAVMAAPAPARANGRFPAANMLVARPGDASHLVLRATYGVLFSSDGGATWDWSCEKAVGYSGSEDPAIAVTGSGAMLAGMFRGFARSIDGGCSWQREAEGPEGIVDMALRPSAPDRVYAVSSLFSAVGDAGTSLFRAELLVSDDAGAHWSLRAKLDPSLLIDSVEVAPSDPTRVYVSAIRPHGKDTQGVLLVSNDDGVRFTERTIPFGTSDRGVYIGAVDPNRANRVYLRTSGVDASRLVVSDDAGKTTRTTYEGGTLLGFALSEDGATIYAGGPSDGLLVASANELRFTKRSSQPVQCLTNIGTTLWACAPTTSGFVLGASTNGGATFTPKLTLAGTRGPMRCATATAATDCAADWTSFRLLAGIRDVKDAGTASTSSPAAAPRACGCAAVGAGSRLDPGAAWPLGLALGGLLRRARVSRCRRCRRPRRA